MGSSVLFPQCKYIWRLFCAVKGNKSANESSPTFACSQLGLSRHQVGTGDDHGCVAPVAADPAACWSTGAAAGSCVNG